MIRLARVTSIARIPTQEADLLVIIYVCRRIKTLTTEVTEGKEVVAEIEAPEGKSLCNKHE